jgi:predicted SAM-dependent methyltransferase
MRANGALYRALRAPRAGVVRVHLGPGQTKYLAGWINADANTFTARCDVWIDLRHPLPFVAGSVDAFYSHHVIEHLPNIRAHLADILRCLKPGGVYRVAGPHGDNAIRKFIEKDSLWFGDFPDKRRSIGGRLENFIFCRNEHLTLLTESYLGELLADAGFGEQILCSPRATQHPRLFDASLLATEEQPRDVPQTLVIEAVKSA